VLTGGNPYENISSALLKLGFSSSAKSGYEKAFGISLAKHSLKQIGANNLNAETSADSIAESNVPEWDISQEASLRTQANQWFKQIAQSREDEAMTTRVQKISAGMLSGILLAAVSTEAEAAKKYAVGVCQVQQKDLLENLYPIAAASSYIYNYQRDNPIFKSIDLAAFKDGAKLSLLSRPKLGVIDVSSGRLGDIWNYLPTKLNEDGTYVGRDHFVVKVAYKSVAVFVHYYIEVIGSDPPTYIGDDTERHNYFCNPETWKISKAPDASITDKAAQLRYTQLSTSISDAGDAVKGWQGLSGAAVCTTVGAGNSAQITLDPTAAGDGWYLDPTPLDNTDDFLPTADKTIWRAKFGSAADGKMDMLSVLLHEYGHVLGLAHSGDSSDFMAATLQPGERRLPTESDAQVRVGGLCQAAVRRS